MSQGRWIEQLCGPYVCPEACRLTVVVSMGSIYASVRGKVNNAYNNKQGHGITPIHVNCWLS